VIHIFPRPWLPVLIPTLEMILLIEQTMAGDLDYTPEPYRLDPAPVEAAVEVERRVVVVIMNG
jgi:hypothetical protein